MTGLGSFGLCRSRAHLPRRTGLALGSLGCHSGFIQERSRANGQPLIVEQAPQGGMSVSTGRNHHKSRAKPRKISARFASISSAEGAGPYLANIPRPVSKG